tara:strand:- start:877 stop:1122 length:246 start_codon:yes stop_codon:yes gene_type:complete
MSNLRRKLMRNKLKQDKKAAAKKIAERVMKFERLPGKCLNCEKEYDKKSREYAMTWHVIVRADDVKLYCPNCWEANNDSKN